MSGFGNKNKPLFGGGASQEYIPTVATGKRNAGRSNIMQSNTDKPGAASFVFNPPVLSQNDPSAGGSALAKNSPHGSLQMPINPSFQGSNISHHSGESGIEVIETAFSRKGGNKPAKRMM